MARDEAAQEPGRATDALRDAAVPTGGAGGGRSPPPASGSLRWTGTTGNPARIELRARCRPLRVRAVLPRDEREADVAEAALDDAPHRLRRFPGHRRLEGDLSRLRVG